MKKSIDERLDAVIDSLELLTTHVHGQAEKHEKDITAIMEGTARLLHVAEIHEARLSRPEGNEEAL